MSGDSIVSGNRLLTWTSPEEPLLDVVARAYETETGQSISSGLGGGPLTGGMVVASPSSTSEDYFYLIVDREITIRQFGQALGELASADPPLVTIVVDGIGGDFIGDFAEIASDGSSAFRKVRGVLRLSDRVRYAEHRHEVGEWQDSGEISMRLRQLVNAETEWDPSEFARKFGISGSERGRLLRALGYTTRTRNFRKTWIEVDPK